MLNGSKMLLSVLFMLLGGLSASPAPGQAVHHVSAMAAGANDGTSWADAFAFLEDALSAAEAGDEIWVAAGTYRPDKGNGNRHATFQLKSSVTVFGGFAGWESRSQQRSPDTNVTILSGDIGTAGSAEDNSFHVVTGTGVDSSAILDGLKITSGQADGTFMNVTDRGAGLLCNPGSPTVRDCTFTDGWARGGAAIACQNGSEMTIIGCEFVDNNVLNNGGAIFSKDSSPMIINNVFRNNSAGELGGAMNLEGFASEPTLIGNLFEDNMANIGGGIFSNGSQTTLIKCTFLRNDAMASGGGLSSHSFQDTVLTDCVFIGNTAVNEGGALEFQLLGVPTVTGCTVHGNMAGDGGGVYAYINRPVFKNCTFSGNSASGNGGAMFNWSVIPQIENCVFYGNSAGATGIGGGIYEEEDSRSEFLNTIIWNNSDVFGSTQASQLTGPFQQLNYCSVENWNGSLGGVGNSGIDPQFVDADGSDGEPGTADDNLRLASVSQLINDGDPDFEPAEGATDKDGQPRVLCGQVDIGAYEQGIGDFTCNGTVDLADFIWWWPCQTGPQGGPYLLDDCIAFDADADGDTDQLDYQVFGNVFQGMEP